MNVRPSLRKMIRSLPIMRASRHGRESDWEWMRSDRKDAYLGIWKDEEKLGVTLGCRSSQQERAR